MSSFEAGAANNRMPHSYRDQFPPLHGSLEPPAPTRMRLSCRTHNPGRDSSRDRCFNPLIANYLITLAKGETENDDLCHVRPVYFEGRLRMLRNRRTAKPARVNSKWRQCEKSRWRKKHGTWEIFF